MSVLPEVLAANDSYAKSFGDKGSLALPPARGFAILTCMDARLELVDQPVFALHQLCTSPSRAVSPCEYSVGHPLRGLL